MGNEIRTFIRDKKDGYKITLQYGDLECPLDRAHYLVSAESKALSIELETLQESEDDIAIYLLAQENNIGRLRQIIVRVESKNGSKVENFFLNKPFCTRLSKVYTHDNPDTPVSVEFKARFKQKV